MLIIFRTPFSTEYIVEVEGDETIGEIREIIEDSFGLKKDTYFLTITQTIDHLKDESTIKELNCEDGTVIDMGFSEDILELEKEKRKKEIALQNSNRILLQPRTTEMYLASLTEEQKKEMLMTPNFENSSNTEQINNNSNIQETYSDPSNIDELVSQMVETGVTKADALRALRKNNYDFVEACLFLEDENDKEANATQSPQGNKSVKQENNVNNALPSEINIPNALMEDLLPEQQKVFEKLVKKFTQNNSDPLVSAEDIQIIHDVYVACEKDEQSCSVILSEYMTPNC